MRKPTAGIRRNADGSSVGAKGVAPRRTVIAGRDLASPRRRTPIVMCRIGGSDAREGGVSADFLTTHGAIDLAIGAGL